MTSKEPAAYVRGPERTSAILNNEFPGYENVYDGLGVAEFRDESPALGTLHRRQFLSLAAATATVVSLAGCRRPPLEILPYAAVPDDQLGHVIHGLPTFYATAQPRPGGALPLLVESHDGRPTKIEGHPRHPASGGSTDALAQASIYDLYSPDRVLGPLAGVRERRSPRRWEDFDRLARTWAARWQQTGGAGLAILTDQTPSPSLRHIREHIRQTLPQARWFTYEPLDYSEVLRGSEIAFGQKLLCRYDLARLDCLLACDSDFLGIDPDAVTYARQFAQRRQATAAWMNRLYVVESTYTITGTMADHRLRLPAGLIGAWLVALAEELRQKHGLKLPPLRLEAELPAEARRWLAPVARDLTSRRQRAAVICGYRLPAWVQAIAHLINAALGNHDALAYLPPPPEMLEPGLTELAQVLRGGQIQTLVIVGGNPVLNAPADVRFAEALRHAAVTVRLGLYFDHTSEVCDWHLPQAHYLESWGDTETSDGTLCCVQPLIEPLPLGETSSTEADGSTRGGRSALELLALLTRLPHPQDGQPVVTAAAARSAATLLVRQTFAARSGRTVNQDDFAVAFAQYKQLGFLLPEQDRQRRKPLRPTIQPLAIARSIPERLTPPRPESLEVTFHPDNTLYDGRYLWNPWLQELPDPITKLVWDNAAWVSPQTARVLGLSQGDVVRLTTASGGNIETAVYILPGQADYSIALPMGQCGEMRIARVPGGGGTNVFPLRTTAAMYILSGVRLQKTGQKQTLVTTQEHGVIPQGRDIVRETTPSALAPTHRAAAPGSPSAAGHPSAGREHPPSDAAATPAIGLPPDGHLTESDLRRGFQAGYGHEPPPRGPARDKQRRFPLDLARPEILDSPFQWGMVIDLSVCTGCSACVIACQAENNIPVVGKYEVQRNREMHWIRIDRYFSSPDGQHADDNPRIVSQPVACVHCEQAPCEQVCPVNAAVHSDEGLNLQVYNRCIGTRYCANACPYKVRRFNWFDYNKRPLDELRIPTPLASGGAALTTHLMPETLRMLKNPDVTVRMRGVMEKCTYCVQRLERAKSGAKIAAAEVAQGRRSIPIDPSFQPEGPPSAYRKPRDPKAAGYDLDRRGRVIVPDGLVKTACQAACPTQAIIFGNLLDPNSAVYRAKLRAGEYLLLGELNTKPRTSYLPRLRNPNPEIESVATS